MSRGRSWFAVGKDRIVRHAGPQPSADSARKRLAASLRCLAVMVICTGPAAVAGSPSLAYSATLSAPSTLAPPCRPDELGSSIWWQGSRGWLAGGIYLTNRSAAVCSLSGQPAVHLTAANQTLSVAQSWSTQPPIDDGAPVGTVEIGPGARALLLLWWQNWCGGAIAQPLDVSVALDGTVNGQTLTVPAAIPPNFAGGAPFCQSADHPSVLLVGSFEPNPGGRAQSIRFYYEGVNQRQYPFAYVYLAPLGRPAYSSLAASYRHIGRVTVDVAAIPGYRLERHGATFACIGIELTAERIDGAHQQLGGWYLVTSQQGTDFMVLRGSRLAPGAGPRLLSKRGCAARIPKAVFVSTLTPGGELTLVAPRSNYSRNARVRLTAGLWDAGPNIVSLVGSACPYGNPTVLVENRKGKLLDRGRVLGHCPPPVGARTVLPYHGRTWRLSSILRGGFVQVSASLQTRQRSMRVRSRRLHLSLYLGNAAQ